MTWHFLFQALKIDGAHKHSLFDKSELGDQRNFGCKLKNLSLKNMESALCQQQGFGLLQFHFCRDHVLQKAAKTLRATMFMVN